MNDSDDSRGDDDDDIDEHHCSDMVTMVKFMTVMHFIDF